jgi:acetyl/propionyl-CoA carboxylase alpha subunit
MRRASSTARRAFASDDLYLEKYVPDARHVEVQVLADGHGAVLHMYERECSVQRRHQKIIEETPAPGLPEETRAAMTDAALSAARGIGYEGVGTFEFLLAPDGAFYFLEANTRIQVEHGITEMTVGLDMVAQQISVASGAPLELSQAQIVPRGHAIECRIYAEDPETFLPSPGTLTEWQMPQGDDVRVDTGLRGEDEVTPHFDPLLAKVMVWAETRPEAIAKATGALQQTRVEGVKTNIPFLLRALASPQFTEGRYTTSLAETLTAGAI